MRFQKILILAVCALFAFFGEISAQFPGQQHIFGKNRVQFKNFDWKQFSSSNFDVFFGAKNEELAKLTAQFAEEDFRYISNLIGYAPVSRVRIFVYPSVSDLRQSNIGINQQDFKVGGQTNFAKNVIEVAFNGTRKNFREQLRFEIANALLLDMIYGGNIKDLLQSTYLLSLPNWVLEGAAAYCAYGWNEKADNFVRERLLAGNLKNPEDYEANDAVLVGQSVWNFVVSEYGESNMANILNLIRITRNEKSGIFNVTALPYGTFVMRWYQFYQNQNQNLGGKYVRLPENQKNFTSKHIICGIELPKNGDDYFLTENEVGFFKIKKQKINGGKLEKIARSGSKVINQIYQKNLAFVALSERKIAFFYEEKGVMMLKINEQGAKSKIFALKEIGTVNNAAPSPDGNEIVISAEKNAQSDIFIVGTSDGHLRQLTNDKNDDITPVFAENGKILFSSDRNEKQEVPEGDAFNIFSLDISSQKIEQITNVDAILTHPLYLDENYFLFLGEQSGITQLYRFENKTQTLSQVTDYISGIKDFCFREGKLLLISEVLGKDAVFSFQNFDFKQDKFTGKIPRRLAADLQKVKRKSREKSKKESKTSSESKENEENPSEKEDYNFKTFNKKGRKRLLKDIEKYKNPEAPEIKIGKTPSYESLFGFEQTTFSFAIDPLRNFGLLFELKFSDDLENHKFHVGLFNPNLFFLQNSVLFAEYKYLKNRIDYGLRYDRQTLSVSKQAFTQKYYYNRVELDVSLPANVSSRVSIAPFYANTLFLVSSEFNPIAQQITPVYAHYSGLKAEFVFDNVINTGPNLKDGAQCRARYDQFFALGSAAKTFGQLEIDARYYKKLHPAFTLATRMAYGRFFANDNKGYRIGGVENWLFRRDEERNTDPFYVNEEVGEPFRDNLSDILFVRYATPMRGFDFNKLFGSNYLLLNAEMRIPLLGLFQTTASRSRFVNNLQAILFTDIGAAWSGISPFNRQNSLNTIDISVRPFKATVSNFKDPFLVGYGGGLRSKIFNYFTKFDFAWGLEDGKISDIQYYVSLGYDF